VEYNTHGQNHKCIQILEGNRPLGRLVRKLEDNIKIDYEIE
jgi:hypothetical protein